MYYDVMAVCRSLYGEAALGDANLRMIELARQYGAAAKFPGSGGAIVGLCVDVSKMVRQAALCLVCANTY